MDYQCMDEVDIINKLNQGHKFSQEDLTEMLKLALDELQEAQEVLEKTENKAQELEMQLAGDDEDFYALKCAILDGLDQGDLDHAKVEKLLDQYAERF